MICTWVCALRALVSEDISSMGPKAVGLSTFWDAGSTRRRTWAVYRFSMVKERPYISAGIPRSRPKATKTLRLFMA